MNEQAKDLLRIAAAERLGLEGPHKVHLEVLPATRVEMAPVPRARKEELAANIEAEFHARPDRTKVPETPTPIDDASILEVCRTCQGSCCRSGETHAYLTRAVLTRVKARLKVASEADLLRAYLERVPEVARKDSCIFHGDEGCALPRSMRSETCNRYLCYPLKQLGRDFGRSGYAQLAVSTVEDAEDRVSLLSDGTAGPFRPESRTTETS